MIRRLRWGLGSLLLAVALVGCSTDAASTPTASGSRLASPTTTSQAVTLRASIDLSLGAHVMLLARTTDAALGVRTPEFTAFGTDVHQNGARVAGAIAGEDTRGYAQVSQALTLFDQSALTYTTATFKKDAAGQQAAQGAMTTAYEPQMLSALSLACGIGSAKATPLLRQQIQDEVQVVNAQASGDWSGAYAQLQTAYAHAVAFGDVLATAVVKRSPQAHPGTVMSKAGGFRVQYETALQQQAYLTGMVEAAAIGKRSGEQQAAAQAQSASVAALGSGASGSQAPPTPATGSVVGQLGGALTAVYGQALAYAQATAAQQSTTSAQAGLQQTFPAAYLHVAHGSLGVKSESANSASKAYGAALATQASAEGRQDASTSPQGSDLAAQRAASIGEQLSAAIVGRHPASFR